MAKSIPVNQKRPRGRPATGRDPMIAARLPSHLIAEVDSWAAENDALSRSEAIRSLVELGLCASPRKPKRTTDKARRAASVAAEKAAHEHLDSVLKGETDSVRATRKKQLTSMPGGFKRR